MNKKEYVYSKLDELGINYFVINHKATFSEKETNLNDFDVDITLGKNLFLRNSKKTKYYLVCMPLTKRANFLKLAELLDEKRIEFANENELANYLAIEPGSVSYLNVITADDATDKFKEVTYVIDKELIKSKKIGFHPSDNTATVVTDPKVMIKIYDKYNLNYHILEL